MLKAPANGRLWLHRFGWLVLIWVAGVGALAIVALLLRLLMKMLVFAGG